MTLLIHNARIVGPEGVAPGSVATDADGRIASIQGPDDRSAADRTIDAAGRFLLPGFVDADCRDRNDAFAAAAVGGVTTAVCAEPSGPTYIDITLPGSAIATQASPTDLSLTDRRARHAKIAALSDGTIEAVCSGELPADIYAAAVFDLAVRGAISWSRACVLLSTAPARMLGIDNRKGAIAPGLDADLVLVDGFATRIVPQHTPPTPFDGFAFRGWPMLTVLRGRVVAENEKLIAEAASGGTIPRAGYSGTS